MSVEGSKIDAQLKERLDGWRIGENVWDWVVRKTGIKPTIGGIEWLAERPNMISRTTLRKLKKDQPLSLNRQDIRDRLAKYTFTIPGIKEPIKLGYYGYPPGYQFDALPATDQIGVKRQSNETLKELQNIDFQGAEFRLLPQQKHINKRIKDDFDYVIESSEISFDLCQYCQFARYNGFLPDESMHEPRVLRFEDCISIYLSTHINKIYGVASVKRVKGFELEVQICRTCLYELSEAFLSPIPSLVEKVMSRYHLSQQKLASEMDVEQVTISRLLNSKTEFVKHDLLDKLYKIWQQGPSSKYEKEHQRLLPLIVDYKADVISEDDLFNRIKKGFNPLNPPWEEDSNFLLEQKAITEPVHLNDYKKSGNWDPFDDGLFIDSDYLQMYADSDEISLDFRVKYRFTLGSWSGVGTVSIRYVLVSIENRLLSEYLFYESECSYKQ